MSNQHYFDVPFAFSGDVTAIPDPLQTGGTVSFTEGWNYNYQRDLSTDPAALPIDRSTMNWLFLQITTALQALQSETIPEFITAAQNGGTALAYGPQARVLWSASGNAPFTAYVNILGANNSNTPSASDPTGATTGWQVSCDQIATSAQASAGTNNASIITPLTLAQQTALRALLAGNSSQVFNVAPATAATHAVQLQQAQAYRGQFDSYNAYASGSTITATANQLAYSNTPGASLILPNAAAMPGLNPITILNFGGGTLSLFSTASQSISYASASGATAVTGINMPAGTTLVVVAIAGNQWFAIGGTALAQFNGLQVGAATNSAQAVQLQQAQAMRQQFTAFAGFSTSQTLTVAMAGQAIDWVGGTGTLTLPAVASMTPQYVSTTFYNIGTGNLTIATNGGANIMYAGNASLTNAVVVPPGGSLELATDGTNWFCVDGTALALISPLPVAAATGSTHAVRLSQFPQMPTYTVSQTVTQGGPMVAGTTYPITQQTITFPAFSKTGAFRLFVQLVGVCFSQTNTVEGQFQNFLYDGSTSIGGNAWSIYKKNSGYGASFSDTFITESTYTPGSTVTFAQRVLYPATNEDTQFSLQQGYMRIKVIEA